MAHVTIRIEVDIPEDTPPKVLERAVIAARRKIKHVCFMSGSSNNSALRERLCEAQNHRCCYCGEVMVRTQWKKGELISPRAATIEHVYQGVGGWDYLAAACHECNAGRPDRVSAWVYWRNRPELVLLRAKGTDKRRRKLAALIRVMVRDSEGLPFPVPVDFSPAVVPPSVIEAATAQHGKKARDKDHSGHGSSSVGSHHDASPPLGLAPGGSDQALDVAEGGPAGVVEGLEAPVGVPARVVGPAGRPRLVAHGPEEVASPPGGVHVVEAPGYAEPVDVVRAHLDRAVAGVLHPVPPEHQQPVQLP